MKNKKSSEVIDTSFEEVPVEKQVDKIEEVVPPKNRTIDSVLATIQKEYGKHTIRQLADKSIEKADVISTGSFLLDKATKIGGIPRGRVIELYGEESSGKTTMALHVIAEAQKKGLSAAFVDAEFALDIGLAKGVGVNTDDLVLVHPDYGEQALNIVNVLISSNLFAVVVVDSVAALIPKAELEGDMEDQQMGLQARMLGKAIRKLTAIVSKSNTSLIFINQTRAKLNATWGNPTDTPGGKALKFFSSMRLNVARIGSVKQGDNNIGNKLKITVTKNKLAPPFSVAETELIFGLGINKEGELVDIGVEKGLIEKEGAWFSYNNERLQGKTNLCEYLKNNKEIADKLLKDIEEKDAS